MKNEINIIDSSDLGRLTCLDHATRYLQMVTAAKDEAQGLRQWAKVAAAQDVESVLTTVVDFASCRADWDSSEWSFDCADSNIAKAESFLGLDS